MPLQASSAAIGPPCGSVTPLAFGALLKISPTCTILDEAPPFFRLGPSDAAFRLRLGPSEAAFGTELALRFFRLGPSEAAFGRDCGLVPTELALRFFGLGHRIPFFQCESVRISTAAEEAAFGLWPTELALHFFGLQRMPGRPASSFAVGAAIDEALAFVVALVGAASAGGGALAFVLALPETPAVSLAALAFAARLLALAKAEDEAFDVAAFATSGDAASNCLSLSHEQLAAAQHRACPSADQVYQP